MFPEFTVFHSSDGFQQSLFSVGMLDPSNDGSYSRPTLMNTFPDRFKEVLSILKKEAEAAELLDKMVKDALGFLEPYPRFTSDEPRKLVNRLKEQGLLPDVQEVGE